MFRKTQQLEGFSDLGYGYGKVGSA